MGPTTNSNSAPSRTSATVLRRGLWLANWNALLWASGSGMVSTTLITYLAIELGAKGLAVSLVLATPRFVGLLRLFTPALLVWVQDRRRVIVPAYAASGLAVLLLPLLAAPGGLTTSGSMVALLICWSLYCVTEYIATVALWSWLGDLIPSRVRGRLIGRREQWLVLGRVVGIACSIAIDLAVKDHFPSASRWVPLAISAMLGGLALLLAVLPLARLPYLPYRLPGHATPSWKAMGRALTDRAYLPLLLYSCGLAIANGITGTAQSLFVGRVLGIRYSSMMALTSTMYVGQSYLAPRVGQWIDRSGAKRWMLLAQPMVALGPLFYWLATPQSPWWVAGAYVVWVLYAVLNVGLDSLKLQLAPRDSYAPYLAIYHTLGDLANGCTLLLAGATYDWLAPGDATALDWYARLFLAGFLARLAVTLLLAQVPERRVPPAGEAN